ncbi:uncharacterized protein LOC113367028 [Ctenocephalides felis]|uniref:uncharacterized protein LOC113367028 n=1 Tax=Ctenocephalides felis TaxID=7515 RepID=UPI000E6E575E|nr:uncharacterized protein LOC113367028 [Ctenocephalides felis]
MTLDIFLDSKESKCKCTEDKLGRRHCIPIIYTRGSHYDVGFDIGRTFSSLIASLLEISVPLNESYLPLYETAAGRKVYDDTLCAVKKRMPQYIEELEGTADGAKVPFHKLFLLHSDDILPNVVEKRNNNVDVNHGCTTICINQPGAELLCHTEDALTEDLNHFYFVACDIDGPNGTKEKFTSLCYAGHLPGYTMGYNQHGLVYSINTIQALNLRSGKTPRHFLGRALLAAKSIRDVKCILEDAGCGAADAFSVNATFLDDKPRVFYNIEVAPADDDQDQSLIDATCAGPGKNLVHCNRLLRLKTPEVEGFIIENSQARMDELDKRGTAKCKLDAINALGDQSRTDHNIFQDNGPDDYVKTIAVVTKTVFSSAIVNNYY